MLTRHLQNPILSPNPANSWESFAVFNGTIIHTNDKYFLFYRAMGEEVDYQGRKMRLSTIGLAKSPDGVNFNSRKQFLKPEMKWELFGLEDPRVTKIDNLYFLFYTALSDFPPNYTSIKVAVAVSYDLETISERHLVTPFNAKAMTLFPEKIDDFYTTLLTVNTDRPPSVIGLAQFKELKTLWDEKFWKEWYESLDDHTINIRRVNSDQTEIGAPPVKTKNGWLLVHSYIKHYLSQNVPKEFRIEAVLLDNSNPQKIVGRIETPLLNAEMDYERNGQTKDIVFPSGAVIENEKLKVYYGGADFCCALAEGNLSGLFSHFEINSPTVLKCKKFAHNPLLQPIPEHSWESKAVFNPGVIVLNNKVYLLYRALSDDNISNLGLAVSCDGLYIDERLPEPVYPLRSLYEKPKKIGLAGGVEDARLTEIEKRIYMCYTAYDGETPRLALSSISKQDFLNRSFAAWEEPVVISPPNLGDKNGALFPEKINNKYVFFHRIEPNIVIDAAADLEFKKKQFLGFEGIILPRTKSWDEVKVGISGPPIKTESGWLVFYHGISRIDGHYRIGALLLDLTNPANVIARTPYPILEPETYFEKEGVVPNVVFSCGQAVFKDEVYLYYGGADRVVCGAKIKISFLISYLLKSNQKKYLSS